MKIMEIIGDGVWLRLWVAMLAAMQIAWIWEGGFMSRYSQTVWLVTVILIAPPDQWWRSRFTAGWRWLSDRRARTTTTHEQDDGD